MRKRAGLHARFAPLWCCATAPCPVPAPEWQVCLPAPLMQRMRLCWDAVPHLRTVWQHTCSGSCWRWQGRLPGNIHWRAPRSRAALPPSGSCRDAWRAHHPTGNLGRPLQGHQVSVAKHRTSRSILGPRVGDLDPRYLAAKRSQSTSASAPGSLAAEEVAYVSLCGPSVPPGVSVCVYGGCNAARRSCASSGSAAGQTPHTVLARRKPAG